VIDDRCFVLFCFNAGVEKRRERKVVSEERKKEDGKERKGGLETNVGEIRTGTTANLAIELGLGIEKGASTLDGGADPLIRRNFTLSGPSKLADLACTILPRVVKGAIGALPTTTFLHRFLRLLELRFLAQQLDGMRIGERESMSKLLDRKSSCLLRVEEREDLKVICRCKAKTHPFKSLLELLIVDESISIVIGTIKEGIRIKFSTFDRLCDGLRDLFKLCL